MSDEQQHFDRLALAVAGLPLVGSGRRLLTALALIVAALLALRVGIADAEVPRLVPNGNFPSDFGLGVAVDNSCSLHTPPLTGAACTAFDSSAGDVFVTGFISAMGFSHRGRSEKFDASGRLLSSPSSLTTNLFFTPSKENEENGEFPPPLYGVAVNPTNGHVYVADPLSGEVVVYDSSTGEQLASFKVPAFIGGFFELFENGTQIATDSAGDVYVPNVPNNEVLKYGENSKTGEPPLQTFTGSCAHALKGPTGVVVDSAGNVWVADDGNNRIEEFDPTGKECRREFASEGVRTLVLDGHGDVFAIVDNNADFCGLLIPPCDHLVEYNESGAQLADLGAGDLGASEEKITRSEQASMVAVNETSGRVYVSDAFNSRVFMFQPPVAPVLGQESAAEVGTTEAKLGVLVNPGGIVTTYRFEYDTRAYGEGEGPHGVSVPFPEGRGGEGFSARTVWASAKNLEPGTTYHYRAVATNGLGTVVGPDQTFTTLTAAQVACPNEQARGGFSAALPDCRAYELVTPPNKASAQPDFGHLENGRFFSGGGEENNYAATDGDRFSYVSLEVMPGSQSAGLEFVATRGASGWSSQDALPLQPYTGERCTIKDQSDVLGYSADLSKAVVVVNNNHPPSAVGNFGIQCRAEAVEVAPGEPLGAQNLLLRDNVDGTYQLINLTPPGVTPTDPSLVAASADLSVVVFSERAKLTPDAENNVMNLYEWREGIVRRLAGVPVEGSSVNISSDGSEIFFTAGGKLYARLGYGERTVQLDEARGGSGPGGGGSFTAVTADGSQVLFTDDATAGLTSDTIPGSGTNLYRYDVDTGQLSDLTPASDAKASLVGISDDGSYVYFTSEGVLTGTQTDQFGRTAREGQSNLYLDYNGTITFVMPGSIMSGGGGKVSSNGTFFAFNSEESLTGYDNTDAMSGNADPEIYLYNAGSNAFVCASCNPSGEAPRAHTGSGGEPEQGGVTLSSDPHAPHFVSNDGQVFFQTGEALLPQDTNSVMDVYEYGWGSGLHLVSTGTSGSESILLDASPSGSDVFFLTRQGLVPQDNFQEANKIYDARVDGGFPEPAVPPVCTTADACRSASPPQPSVFGEPASQTFSGARNVAPPAEVKPKKKGTKCKKGSAKKRGGCVKSKRGKKAKNSSHRRRR